MPGAQALRQFSKLPYFAVEQLSTHTVMAICEAELGNTTSSEAHEDAALVHGTEFADVPAELAFLATLFGDTDKALTLTSRARLQQHRNRSDAVGDALLEHALAASELRSNLGSATARLGKTIFDFPLELGYSLEREALLSQALLLAWRRILSGVPFGQRPKEARVRKAHRAESRLADHQCTRKPGQDCTRCGARRSGALWRFGPPGSSRCLACSSRLARADT